MRGLNGRRVLVTGATGGIGQAIARAFAARGAHVLLSGRRADVLEQLAGELGAGASVCIADLGVAADVERLAESAAGVDIAVLNAGLPATALFWDWSPAQIDTLIDVNLRAPIALAGALVPGMRERRCGHLVFISSLSGKAASSHATLYNATKFGLRGFGLALREDLHGSGVSASVVNPGFISDAGMFADAAVGLPPGVGTKTPEQVAAGVIRSVRWDRPEVNVAPLALRLGSTFGGALPGVNAIGQRLGGGERLARAMSDAQVDKRPGA